jgi:hypothetical protein
LDAQHAAIPPEERPDAAADENAQPAVAASVRSRAAPFPREDGDPPGQYDRIDRS